MSDKPKIINTGRPASTLVGIITILIIFYIIFLPQETRTALLEGENITDATTGNTLKENQLIQEQIGKLSYIKDLVIDHYITGSYLEQKKESKIIAEYDNFMISKGIFEGQEKKKLFTIPELEKTTRATITFQAPVRQGTLKIALNGETIFEEELLTNLPKPVEIPIHLLQKNNELVFSVEGGLLSEKEYRIEDLKIIAQTSDEERLTAQQSFTVPGAEIDNFDEAYLEFRAACTQKNAGELYIKLNDRTISSTTPACDNQNKIEVFKEDLNKGKNEITFELKEGTTRIENAKIRVYLKEQKGYTNFFTIEKEEWKKIDANDKKVIMDIEFIDDELNKRSEINVNGRRMIADQEEPHYTKDITRYVKEGNNYIQIKPLTEVTIVDLEVRLEDK